MARLESARLPRSQTSTFDSWVIGLFTYHLESNASHLFICFQCICHSSKESAIDTRAWAFLPIKLDTQVAIVKGGHLKNNNYEKNKIFCTKILLRISRKLYTYISQNPQGVLKNLLSFDWHRECSAHSPGHSSIWTKLLRLVGDGVAKIRHSAAEPGKEKYCSKPLGLNQFKPINKPECIADAAKHGRLILQAISLTTAPTVYLRLRLADKSLAVWI